MNSSFNHRDLPLVNELVLIAMRKAVSEKLVAPGVTRFPLVWPAFWWPSEIRPKADKSPETVQRNDRTTSLASAAETVTSVLRRLKGRNHIIRTKAIDLGFSEWRPVTPAVADFDSWLLRSRSLSIGDLRAYSDEGRRSHPGVRKRSRSLHDDELGESWTMLVKNRKGLLGRVERIRNLIIRSFRSAKKLASEGISRESSAHSQSSESNGVLRLHHAANAHSTPDLRVTKSTSSESFTLLTRDKGKRVLSEVIKIGKKITKVLHDSHQQVSPHGSISAEGDGRQSPTKIHPSPSGSSLDHFIATQQRCGYLRLETTSKRSIADYSVELRDAKGRPAGTVDVTVCALHLSEDVGSLKKLDFCISKIAARGLRNVDIRGTNDPYLEVTFGRSSIRTSVIHDGGRDVDWQFGNDNLSTSFSVSVEELRSQELKIVARDYNKFMSHVLIGEGRVNLKSIGAMVPSDGFRNDSEALVWVVLKAQQIIVYGRKSDAGEEQAPLLVADLSDALIRYSSKRPVFEIKYISLKDKRSTLNLWASRQSEMMEWVRSLTSRPEDI